MKRDAISSVDCSRHANMRRNDAMRKLVPSENQVRRQIWITMTI